MTAKFEVTLLNDYESMFGGVDTREMDGVDIEATVAAYEAEIDEALKKLDLPITWEHIYQPHSSPSIRILDLSDVDDDTETEDNIRSEVEYVIERVFERGQFWTARDPEKSHYEMTRGQLVALVGEEDVTELEAKNCEFDHDEHGRRIYSSSLTRDDGSIITAFYYERGEDDDGWEVFEYRYLPY